MTLQAIQAIPPIDAGPSCPGPVNPFAFWAMVIMAFVSLTLIGSLGCTPGDLSLPPDTETETGDGESGDDVDLPLSPIADIGGDETSDETGEPPTTSIVDACCWCDGSQPHCVEWRDIPGMDQLCDDVSGLHYEQCILVSGTEPFCYEHVCN